MNSTSVDVEVTKLPSAVQELLITRTLCHVDYTTHSFVLVCASVYSTVYLLIYGDKGELCIPGAVTDITG